MKRLASICGILILILAGCKSPTPVEPLPEVNNDRLERVNFSQVDYYTIFIENSDSLFVEAADTADIKQILSGYIEGETFIASDTLKYHYSNAANSLFLLSFQDSLTVPDTSLYINAGIKYVFAGSDSFYTGKNLFLLNWPYSSVNIIINGYFKILPPLNEMVQDFVYRPPILYYHLYGPYGLFRYDLSSFYGEEICVYPGGDFFDMNSTDAYIDYGHQEIWKYNLERDTVLIAIDLQDSLGYRPAIYGVAVNDSIVYVLIEGAPSKLIILNTDLEILSIMDFYYGGSILNYYDGFFYVWDGGYSVTKIDAETLNVVDTKKLPSIHGYRFKVENGLLYFMENQHMLFCSVPLEDIF